MGRTDLASHRSSLPSDTKPIPFPKGATWVLEKIAHTPNTSIESTLASIRDATTQRTQVSALKLLGIQLRDAHTRNNSSGQRICACMAESVGNSDEVYFCRMVGSVIAGVLLDSPDATPGLVTTALRAVLRCPIRMDDVHQAFSDFFSRLERASSSKSPVSGNPVSALATDICLISVIVSDPQIRSWVFDHEERIIGSLRTIQDVVQLYLVVTMTDEIQTMNLFSRTDHTDSPMSQQVQNAGDNKRLLENACDFSLKSAQDLLNGLPSSRYEIEMSSAVLSAEITSTVKNLVSSCKELLLLSTIPRNCALACSIAYVSGLLITEDVENDAEKVSQLLKTKLFAELLHFPYFSRLSLLRAVMEAPAARAAHELILFPSDDRIGSTEYNFTVFERLVLMVEENGDAHLRFLAMDALVKCIQRRYPLKLDLKCRNAVVSVIKGRWNETFPGTTLQMKKAIEALISVDGNDPESNIFWEEMTFSLVRGSWSHRGIYAPLSVLITRVGAIRLLECEPRCQERAIEAACGNFRLTKPAADWLGSFWKTLRKECGKSDFSSMTCTPLLSSLTCSRKSFREITARQILPVYFQRLDKELVKLYANSLLSHLRKLHVGNALKARAMVTIMSVSRNYGVFVGSFSESGVLHLLTDALTSADDEMRSTAFELIVTSRAPTEPINQEELDLVLMYLPIALTYSSSLSHRSRFRHSMRRFFERFAACQKAASDGRGGWWTRERKTKYGGTRTKSFENMREALVERLVRFETACFKILMANVYPGAVFERRMNAFELLVLMSKNLGLQQFICPPNSYGAILAGISAGLLDQWERTRHSALQVLLSLPNTPPGMQNFFEATAVQEASIPLLKSPKLRDVDSGASIIIFLHNKFVLPMAASKKAVSDSPEMKYLSFPNGLCSTHQQDFNVRSLSLHYAKSILMSLEEALDHSRMDFPKACESGLFHGMFRILREVLKECGWKDLASACYHEVLSSFVCKIIDLAWSCSLIALKYVSFEALSSSDLSDEELEDDEVFIHEEKQLERTSSFLSLKEICVTLGVLIHRIPLEGVSSTTEERGLIGLEGIERIGNLFLHVFRSTRHWGIIDGAAEGFQLLCERLQQASNFALRSLPKVWSLKMINEALGGNLYVLRRSAGLPALVNAVVNSEAISDCRSLHAPLLDGIVTFVLKHLEQSHMFVDPGAIASERSKEEEGVSHALNILRSLFLNTKIGKRILKYFEKTVMHCVEAFCSASWVIRNSAMMLFSALIRRGIGVDNNDDSSLSTLFAREGASSTLPETRRMQGVTPIQFFSMYPKLHHFLRTQLQLSVLHSEKDQNTEYPSLFPTLYLLSSLSPGAPEDPATMVSMEPFREVLRICAHCRSDYIRRAAASASLLLVEDHRSTIQFLKELVIKGIPTDPNCNEVTPEKDISQENCENEPRIDELNVNVLRQNHFHGDLLTIEAILKWTSQVSGTNHVKAVVQMFAQHIPNRIWLTSSRNPCSFTRASFIRVLSIVYRLACDLVDDPKATELVAACNSVFNLCHELDDKLRTERLYLGPREELIGLSVLREASSDLSRLRFFRNTQTTQQRPHIPTLQMFLSEIESNDSELKMIAFENTRLVLSTNVVDRFRKDEPKSISVERVELLQKIWSHAKHTSQVAEDDELLISALRIQGALFDFWKHQPPSDCFRQFWTEQERTRIVEHSRYHAWIDVREEALVLLGKAVALYPGWICLSSAWMEGLEIAASSENSSSRMAVCTSLSASKIESSEMCTSFSGELRARGYLLWTRLLQDDHADVVGHALSEVQTYLWEERGVAMSVLPTLTEIFDRLADRHKRSPALFRFAKSLLGSSTEGEKGGSLLFNFLGTLSDKMLESTEPEHRKVKGIIAGESLKPPLFELEEISLCGEKILGMQLTARCYSKIFASEEGSNNVQTKAESLVDEFSRELKATLECASQSINPGLFGSQSFSNIGFETCYAAILRAFLGIRCIQLSNCGNTVALKEMITKLRNDTPRWNQLLHPVLTMALNGLCALVDGKQGAWESEATEQILFLL